MANGNAWKYFCPNTVKKTPAVDPTSENILYKLQAINSTLAGITSRITRLESQVIGKFGVNRSSPVDPLSFEQKFQRLETNQVILRGKIAALSKDYQHLHHMIGASPRLMNEDEGNVTAIVDVSYLLRSNGSSTVDKFPLTEEDGDRLIENLVTYPKARLYTGENHTGDFEEYNFTAAEFEGGCHHLNLKPLRSVDTFGKCVRLFDGGWCRGWSLAIYPGSGDSLKLPKSKLAKVESIGPCLRHEFLFDCKKGRIIKNSSDLNTYIPDLNEFSSLRRVRGTTKVSPENGPVSTNYHLGKHDRLEYLSTWIEFYPNNTNNTDGNGVLTSPDKKPGDVLGYAIPPHFGGPSDEVYNIYPSSPSARDKWMEILSQVKAFIEKRKRGMVLEPQPQTVVVGQKFEYENDDSTRPYAFDYHIQFRMSNLEYGIPNLSKILYGRIFNN
ncbi:unnamed protein product [Allacma fusca]|uniref:Uncharacterized protein n=1 Tax=Allacma fusca TaxID=39272 RepID=A0A8J2JYZ1_9HEXA|nr:unnamed protein product [Allacma fusca]